MLVVAGEGFEPSKAKPTDLQDEVQTVVTSDYGPRPPGQGTYRARSPPRVAAIPFAPSSPQRRRRGEVQVMYACSPVPPHTNVPMRSFRPRRLQVGEDFLYVFKPGPDAPDAPPLHPAALPLRSRAPGGWRGSRYMARVMDVELHRNRVPPAGALWLRDDQKAGCYPVCRRPGTSRANRRLGRQVGE